MKCEDECGEAVVLNLVCASCGKSCRSKTESDLHTKRTGHDEFVDNTLDSKDAGDATATATEGNSSLKVAIEWIVEHENDFNIDEMPLVPISSKSEASKPSLTPEEIKIKAQELKVPSKVMPSIVKSSKQGDRHHQWLRMGLDVRPRLSIISKDFSDLLAFCFNEKARLQDCCSDICSPNGEAINGIKSLLDLITTEPRIRYHVGHEVVESLVHHLFSNDHLVKIEAALILPRLKGCPDPLMKEIIHVLKNQFLHGHNLMRYEVMCTLTFLASDYPSARGAILDGDILEVVWMHFDKIRLEEYKVIIECANFLSAFCCRNRNLPEKKKELVLDTVKTLFKSMDIEGVMPAVCCTFYHLSYQQEMPIEETVIRKLLWLAFYRYSWISIPALMVVGNIVRWGQDQQIESMISKKDMLKSLQRLLENDSKLVQREACWIISNITATSRMEISSSHSVIVSLCRFLKDEASDVQMDAAWAIFNFFTHDFAMIKWPVRRSSGFSTFATRKRKGTSICMS